MTEQEFKNQSTSSPELGKLFEALSKTQAMIVGAKEDSHNPYFKSKYADLSSVWEACRLPLSENGLSVVQSMETVGDKICLVTILGHSSGQWIKSCLPVPITKSDPQTLGSALTYCRRYALSALVGVCPIDDDGEAAMNREPPKELLISTKQSDHLYDLIGNDEKLKNNILKWCGVENLDLMPVSKYHAAIKELEKRKAKEMGVA